MERKLISLLLVLNLVMFETQATYVLFKLDFKNKTKAFKLSSKGTRFGWGRFSDGEDQSDISPNSNNVVEVQGRVMSLTGVEGSFKWEIIHTATSKNLGTLIFEYACPFSMLESYYTKCRVEGEANRFFACTPDSIFSAGGHTTSYGGFTLEVKNSERQELLDFLEGKKWKPDINEL